MVHHIENERVLTEVIKSDKLVIVDFFAEWCGPCQMLAPILQEVDKEYSETVEIFKVNVDESADCAMRYGVTAMPTMVFFKDGEEVERVIGFIPKDELEKIIRDF